MSPFYQKGLLNIFINFIFFEVTFINRLYLAFGLIQNGLSTIVLVFFFIGFLSLVLNVVIIFRYVTNLCFGEIFFFVEKPTLGDEFELLYIIIMSLLVHRFVNIIRNFFLGKHRFVFLRWLHLGPFWKKRCFH